jgi:hypothetical protein
MWRAVDSDATRWETLTEGWRELRAVLRLVPSLSLRDVDFEPTSALSLEMTSAPLGIVLVKLVRIDTGASAGVSMSWTSANGRVVIGGLGALAAGRWRATFLIVGGT